MRQPRLNIFAGRASIVAGRQKIDEFGPPRAQCARAFGVTRKIRALCQVRGRHEFDQIIGRASPHSHQGIY
jgi:hypothetical protein